MDIGSAQDEASLPPLVIVLAGGIGGLIYFFYRRPKRIKERHEKVKDDYWNQTYSRDRD